MRPLENTKYGVNRHSEAIRPLDAKQAPPTEYYISVHSGEEIDAAVGDVLAGKVVIPSSTSGSTKKFQIKVDDNGAITATEVTA